MSGTVAAELQEMRLAPAELPTSSGLSHPRISRSAHGPVSPFSRNGRRSYASTQLGKRTRGIRRFKASSSVITSPRTVLNDGIKLRVVRASGVRDEESRDDVDASFVHSGTPQSEKIVQPGRRKKPPPGYPQFKKIVQPAGAKTPFWKDLRSFRHWQYPFDLSDS